MASDSTKYLIGYNTAKSDYDKQFAELQGMDDAGIRQWWSENIGDWDDFDVNLNYGKGWDNGVYYSNGLGKMGTDFEYDGRYGYGYTPGLLLLGHQQAYDEFIKQLADFRKNKTLSSEVMDSDAAGRNIQHEDQKANENLVDAQDAMKQSALQAQQVAENTAKNAAAAGVSKSQAGTLSDNAAQQTQTQSAASYAAANAAQRSSTQADYMEKMQKVAELQNQAMLSKKAEGANIWSAAVQGGATGLMFANNMLSDERMKEPPKAPRAGNKERSCPKGMLNDSLDEKEMRKMIKQFKDLYTRVKKLKANEGNKEAK